MHETPEATTSELRKFGIIMGIFIMLFFGLLIPWIWDFSSPSWVWIASGTFIGLGLIVPITLKPVFIVWMKFAHVIGWINTRLLLSIVFYLIVMPIGLIMRLFGTDPMHRKFDEKVTSYRVKSKQPSVDHLEKPF